MNPYWYGFCCGAITIAVITIISAVYLEGYKNGESK